MGAVLDESDGLRPTEIADLAEGLRKSKVMHYQKASSPSGALPRDVLQIYA
jgi:hypothetical protein